MADPGSSGAPGAKAGPGLLPYLALAGTALIWSGNWVAGRGLHQDMGPVALSFWRWVVALAVFLPFTAGGLWAQRAVIAGEWRRLAVLAFLGITAFNAMVYLGLRTTQAINGTFLNSTGPIFVIVIAWFGLGDRTTLRQIVGVAVSMAGVLTIISRGSLEILLGLRFGLGDLVILAAIFLWALYTVLLRQWRTALTPLTFQAAIMVIGFVMLAPVFAVEQTLDFPTRVNWRTIGGVLYLGIFASTAAYLFWNFGVRQVGAARATLFQHLIPVFAAILAILLLGERLRAFHVAGVALILAGIYIATASRPIWRRGNA